VQSLGNAHSPESCWGMLDSVSASWGASMAAAEAEAITTAAANKPVVVVAMLQQLVPLLGIY